MRLWKLVQLQKNVTMPTKSRIEGIVFKPRITHCEIHCLQVNIGYLAIFT